MKKRAHILRGRCLSLLCVMAMIFTFGTTNVWAAGSQTQAPMLMIEKYSVTDEKIVPGQNFTLTLTLKNNSDTAAASNIMIDVTNPAGVAPIYGTTSQVFVGEIGAGRTKEVSIEYRSWTSIEGNSLDFNLTILSNQATNYVVLRIPVGSDYPVNVNSVSISPELRENEVGNATVVFDVLSEANISNLTMVLRENGETIASSTIGNVTAGTLKSQNVSFSMDTVGKHTVDVILQYNDETGQTQEIEAASQTITVQKASSSATGISGDGEDSTDKGDHYLALMGIGGVLIVVIFLLVISLLRKRGRR